MIKVLKIILLCAVVFASAIFCSCKLSNDFARLDSKNKWSHHYAYGSPSWDNFERFPNNPVLTGCKGKEWPVNGFLFSDPVSENWYLYVGEYRQNYDMVKDSTSKSFNCVLFKSDNKGKTWEKTGDLFPMNFRCYDSLQIQVPDIMVVFAEGKYHMVFDWISNNATWQEMSQSGIGYAVADMPEGPFVVSREPVKINTQYRHKPLLGKYWRMYAAMIVKRKNDWVLLYMMDTSPARSWVLAASTSQKPEGPYSDPILLRNVEGRENYPPLQEYFPAFTHNGYVYCPSTSVALNRDCQMISRAKTEDVTNPARWEVFQKGSIWHSINTDNEFAGIWGQTITGFVDHSDSLYVMYPSKNGNNYGTINMAKAPWPHFFGDKGFSLSASEGRAFTYLKRGIRLDQLEMDFTLEGTMQIVWDFHQTIDIDNFWGKFNFDQGKGTYEAIEISQTDWSYRDINKGVSRTIDSGKVSSGDEVGKNLQIKKEGSGYIIYINGKKCSDGILSSNPGIVGIMLEPHSYLSANRFYIKGKQVFHRQTYGFREALLAAGNMDADWEIKKDPMFRNGTGAVSKSNHAFAKWNFEGTGCEIYLPKGPAFGSVAIYIDGELAENIILKNNQVQASTMVFKSKRLCRGAHSVYLESSDAQLPLDCIDVIF